MRSTTGLTSAHTGGRSTGPRGVLFLAGPTGVGKTELAKILTEVIFGNPNAYIRFDMSEFSNTGSDLRLMGAPPGYIGHEAGGELTNAVRQKPFSLVLFDEIEKAHPPIMDKFLQILSDGRLTDGSGATVHFSETIIVFTSNKGMADPLPNGDLPTAKLGFPEFDAHVRQSVSRHFAEELGRPELLNRLGDNIVVFDFIRTDVATELLTNFVANTLARVRELHAIDVTLAETAHKTLWRECCSDLSMGGRGIGQRVESVLTNPLARAVFLHDDSDSPIHIRNFIREEGGAWALDIG
nr:AAA family ATPase [Aeromicrobium duanguangcaii]